MLWLVVLLFYRKETFALKNFKPLLLLTFFEPFVYFIGETYGLQRVSPVITSLIISTIPIFTALSSRVIFHTKLLKINVLGIIISFIGVVSMLISPNMSFETDGIGLLLLLLAVLSAVVYGFILNKLASKMHPVLLIASQNTIGVLYFVPLCLFSGEKLQIMPVADVVLLSSLSPTMTFWVCLLILSVFSSSLAFIFYSFSVKQIGITRSNIFTNLIPIFTAITSYILLGEQLTGLKIAGIILIILGLILVQVRISVQKLMKINGMSSYFLR
jgi:drug/metabolite transporter (DMT)-like permease